jgi:acyl-CoA synthetase (AMP-forming)/AMP-acid ligase II
MHVPLLLELSAEAGAERTAVGPRGEGITYGALQDLASRAATWIAHRRANRVCLVAEASEIVPIALFGSAISRRPFAPLNYRLPDDRLGELLAGLAPAVAIVDETVLERVAPDGVELITGECFLASLLASDPTAATADSVDVDDVAVTLFTSGTSASPKPAVLRQRNLAAYVISTVELMGAGVDEATLVSTPPYHIAGITGTLSAVYGGRRIVYLPSFDPVAWVDTVRRESITHAMVVPTMLVRILDVIENESLGLPTLRQLSYGGGAMPLPVIERALALLPHVGFVNAYGLTETSSTITILGPEDHRAAVSSADPAFRRRLRSVGRPLPTVELVILSETGEPLATGHWGEVATRGDQVSGEYDDSTAAVGAWFRTRDRGMLDADGFLYLDGRIDDVIVRGGENLSPGAIEEVLLTHPAVAAAAVVATPSVEWGEEPVAFVVASGTDEAELKTWVHARLRSASTPLAVFLRDELPYTSTGKLLRRQLRAEAASLVRPDLGKPEEGDS